MGEFHMFMTERINIVKVSLQLKMIHSLNVTSINPNNSYKHKNLN